MNSALRRTVLIVAVAAAVPISARAQGGAASGITFYSGFEARSVSFKSGLGLKSATEYAVPLGAVWTVSPRLSLDLGVRYASATRGPEATDQADATVSGLGDTQVRAVYQIVPDVLVFTLAANLPTGKTKLTDDELIAAGVVASDLIPFPAPSFGSGANATTGIAAAGSFAGWAVGVGGSYRLSGSFTPIASRDTAYKPGAELRLRVGADRVIGQGRVSLGFTYSSFSEDEFGGAGIFRPGRRYISQASWSFPVGNLGVSLYAWDLYRNAGTVALSGSRTEKQNVLTAGAALSVRFGRSVLRPQVEFRQHTIGETSLEKAGQLLSLSARYQMPLGQALTLSPTLRYDVGNVVNAIGDPVSFTGWGLSLGLRAAL